MLATATMPHKILIVDDDQIFNSLLTDVFKQAGYTVRSANSGDEALAVMDREPFDLVVTDQRMPGILGTQFVRKVMAAHKDLPIVMVSGFLENDTIRELIRDGVGGVFIKPLNIFQLLKRAAQLIERRERLNGGPAEDSEQGPAPKAQPHGVRSFPGRSPKAVQFTRKLQELCDFSSNLLLVGRKGTDFEAICRDLCDMSSQRDELVYLTNAALASDSLATRLAGLASRGGTRLTIAIAEPDKLSPDLSQTILAISRREDGFGEIALPTRFVFCMREELDALFDSGRIDENLYLFMGTMELRVPTLAELRDDIPLMAQAILDQEEAGAWRIDSAGASFLKEQDWPGEALQLAKVLSDAAGAAQGRVIGARELDDAYHGRLSHRRKATENLKQALAEARDEYVRAMLALCNSDEPRAALALGIPLDTLRRIAKA